MAILNKQQILERGWTEEVFDSITENKGQIVKNGENFWHLNFIEKIEKSDKLKGILPSENIEQSPVQSKVENKKLLNREEILARGWSKEAFNKFITNKQQKKWQIEQIQKWENHIDFHLFNHPEFNKVGQDGINIVQSLNIEFEKNNHLIANIHNYNPLKPIFHLVKKDFAPEENGSYSLFTDGSFKTVDKKAFATCGGWILDNKSKEVILEFSKSVELDESQKRSKPNFELMGISEGVKLIKQLKIKNVQIYSDSLNEAGRIFLALHDFKDFNFKQNKELYQPIIDDLKKNKVSIAWIPREYNIHADKLADIPLKAWEKENDGVYKEKDYIAEHGYKVNRDEVIYFHQNKAECKNERDSESRFTLITVSHKDGNKQYIVSAMHDRVENSLSLLECVPRNFSYIDENLPEEVKSAKRAKADSIIIMHIARAIKHCEQFGDINVCVPGIVIAVNNKATPIPSDLQEEFFELHKALNEYPSKITMVPKIGKLQEKIKDYLQIVEEKHFDNSSVSKKMKNR
jgi:ribonuclease HI